MARRKQPRSLGACRDEEAVDEPVEEDLVLLEKNVGSSHGDPQDHVVFQIFD